MRIPAGGLPARLEALLEQRAAVPHRHPLLVGRARPIAVVQSRGTTPDDRLPSALLPTSATRQIYGSFFPVRKLRISGSAVPGFCRFAYRSSKALAARLTSGSFNSPLRSIFGE